MKNKPVIAKRAAWQAKLLLAVAVSCLQLSNIPTFGAETIFDLDANWSDTSSSYTATPNHTPTYFVDKSRAGYEFDTWAYATFPASLTGSMTNDIIRFTIEFKVDCDEADVIDGEPRHLFGCTNDGANDGLSLFIEGSGNDDISLWTSVGDGIHPRLDTLNLSSLEMNKWYYLCITVDTSQSGAMITYLLNTAEKRLDLVNGVDPFDLNAFKNLLLTKSHQLGGSKYGAGENTNNWNRTNVDPYIDRISFQSPLAASDNDAITNALTVFKNHVNGASVVSDSVLEMHLSNVVREWRSGLSQYNATETEVLEYLSAFEASRNSPIWSPDRSQKEITELSLPRQLAVKLYQHIHDYVFVSSNLTNAAGIAFKEAEVWPGAINPDAPRVTNQTVKVDGDYNTRTGIRLNGEESAFRFTGYYAAPGELVTMAFSSNVVNQNLKINVGVHFPDTMAMGGFNRLYRISKQYDVDQDVVQVANPNGGSILINVPAGSNLGDFNITINNAIKTAFFSTKQGYETSLSDFHKAVSNACVPWIELESDKIMIAAPMAGYGYVHGKPDPTVNATNILAQWDSMMDAFNLIGGRPPRTRPEMLIVDCQQAAPGTMAPAAYPMPLDEADYTARGEGWGNPLSPKPNLIYASSRFIVLHELGHLHNYPTLDKQGEQESNVNLPAVAAYNLTYGFDLETEAMAHSIDQRLTLEQAAIDWMVSPNFPTNGPMSTDNEEWNGKEGAGNEIQYQSRGHAKWVDIASLFGWEALGTINKQFVDRGAARNTVCSYNIPADDYIRTASYALNLNLSPLFHFWGVIPSDSLRAELNSLPQSRKIKDRIAHYKTLIPESNAAFKGYYQGLKTNELTKSYWGSDFFHHKNRYDGLASGGYNTARINAMKAQIDNILTNKGYFDSAETATNLPFRNFAIMAENYLRPGMFP